MLINFNEVSDEEVTFELLPEGNYTLKVEKCEEKMSSKGNPYWAITYVDKEGNKVFDNLSFTEKTLNRVKKCFKVLGLDVEGSFDYEPSDVIGCYMNADVSIEEYDYNGTTRKKNVINLWQCEPYTAKKVAKKKVEELEDLPF